MQDANFNVTALTDVNGDAVERYSYTPYGERTIYDASYTVQSSSSYAWETLFAGYRYDAETGLYDVRNRVHHAQLGRFLQRDPLGYIDGMSLYEYVQSSPLVGLDPTGQWNLWNPITWGIPNASSCDNSWNPFDESAYWGALADPSVGEGLEDGLAATTDGVIPFADPFADRGYYDPNDPLLQISQTMGGISRDAALAAVPFFGMQNAGTYIKNPVLYEIGSKALPNAAYNSISKLSTIERGAYIVNEVGWLKALMPTKTLGTNLVYTGFTPGGGALVIGGIHGFDAATH